MKHGFAVAVFLGLSVAQAGRADLTLRHTITLKFGGFLPPQAVDAIKQQMGDRMPEGGTLAIQGERVYASMGMGQMFAITDYAKGQITLVDPATRRFATVPLADYPAKILAAQKLPTMPPDAQRIFDNMRLDVQTSKTGQTAMLHGIRTEESLLTISMEVTAGMQVRSEIHLWTASMEELKRTPELRDLAAYAGRAKGALDPADTLSKALSGLPGMGEKLLAPMQEMMKGAGGVLLRMRAATYMPAMAMAMGAPAADQPVTEVLMDLAEISPAPIPASRFEVPPGYQTAAMEDLLGALFPATQVTPGSAAPR